MMGSPPAFTNARHRGELVQVCNELGLTRYAAEIGVDRGSFSQHNLAHWKGERYYMIDAWGHRANDTDARGRPVADKNERSTEWWDGIYASARASVAAFGQRAVLMRRHTYRR